MWTVRALLKEAREFFERKGIPSPRLEAELLLSHVLSFDRVQLFTSFARPVNTAEVDAYRDLVMRRVRGEPSAYIRGVKEFFSLTFGVSPAVLIPRPETEDLVQAALDVLDLLDPSGEGAGVRVADVGTGSGCIPITLAVLRKGLQAAGTDISEAAIGVARANAARHRVEGRIEFMAGNLLEPLETARPAGGFHVLTCNPPYIDPQGPLEVDPSVRRFEPPEALFTPAGDPLHYYRKVLAAAPPLLAPSGSVLFEVAMGMAGAVAALGKDLGFATAFQRADLAGVARVVGFRRTEAS